jgi:16S rRNA processing protein RimM
MMETGADDVMVLKGERERLIPFVIDQIVREVDLDSRRVVVDWSPEY